MKTKIGGKHIKKNIVLGDGSVWLGFIFCFQKCCLISSHLKKKKKTVVKQRDNISNFSEPRE